MKGDSPWLVIILSVISLGLGAYYLYSPNEPSTTKISQPKMHITASEVVEVNHYFEIGSYGIVLPREESELSAEAEGTIIISDVREGDFVKKGDIIAEVNAIAYEKEYAIALANKQKRHLNYLEAKANNVALIEEHKNKITSVTKLGLKEPQLHVAAALLKAADKQLTFAEYMLSRTKIRAPFDGLITKRFVERGEYVHTGEVLYQISAVKSAEIRLPITQDELSLLGVGQGRLTQPIHANLTWASNGVLNHRSAIISKTLSKVDEATQQTNLIAIIEDPYGIYSDKSATLPFGIFVNATITANYPRRVVKLPAKLLKRSKSVVAINNMRIEVKDVSVLHKDGEHVFIDGGLKSGDLISSVSISNPIPGTQVSLTNTIDASFASEKYSGGAL